MYLLEITVTFFMSLECLCSSTSIRFIPTFLQLYLQTSCTHKWHTSKEVERGGKKYKINKKHMSKSGKSFKRTFSLLFPIWYPFICAIAV